MLCRGATDWTKNEHTRLLGYFAYWTHKGFLSLTWITQGHGSSLK